MPVFYMTFGCGQGLAGYVLPVIAINEAQAREYMHKEFGGKWCGTYSTEEWENWKRNAPDYVLIEKELLPIDIRGNVDTCVCCGEYVPEGMQVCRKCEKEVYMKRGNCNG